MSNDSLPSSQVKHIAKHPPSSSTDKDKVTAAINPIVHAKPPPNNDQASRHQLIYDIVMLVFISIDLILIGFDNLLMSEFALSIANFLQLSDPLLNYQSNWHPVLKTLGGFFTIFLVVELLVRWGIAIKNQSYHRWFFFPFVHWYEVLGCFPQLRALRLLRVAVIGYRLYQLGIKVLPQSWISTGVFYYNVVIEEISDRVIIVAIENIKQELNSSDSHKSLIHDIIEDHRQPLADAITELLSQEVAPILQKNSSQIQLHIGKAIETALGNVPELAKLLGIVPIAGKLFQDRINIIGHQLGEQVTKQLLLFFTDFESNRHHPDALYRTIADAVTQVDVSVQQIEDLVSSIIYASLDALKEQVATQQWKQNLDDAGDADNTIISE